MNAEQQTAEAAFAAFSVPAVYNAGAGNVACRVIVDRRVDELAAGNIPTRRTELSLLIAEVGAYQVNATVTIGETAYITRGLIDDDGYVRVVLAGRQ